MWLCGGCVGTVLQAVMKKRKSVSKLDRKDLNKASLYALTTQGVDSDGDIATHIVKVRDLLHQSNISHILF